MTSIPTDVGPQGTEQQRVADGLRALGGELAAVAERPGEPPIVTDLARQATSAAHGLAEWLDQQDPSTLYEELSAFALRHPETFLAISLGAGLAHGPKTAEWTGLVHPEAGPEYAQPLPVDTAQTVDNSPYAGDEPYVDDPAAHDQLLSAPTLLPPTVPATLSPAPTPVPVPAPEDDLR